MSRKLIGGFFGLDLDILEETQDSIWMRWTNGASCALDFENARSVLAYLFSQKKPEKIWLPSYICSEAAPPGFSYEFYPADPLHGVDLEFLSRHVAADDAVLTMNYFGRTPSSDVLEFIKSRPDILWVEDRCHALWSDAPVYGDWTVYSPRKLAGVADGGLLVSYHDEILAPDYAPPSASGKNPARMRYEDKDQSHNDLWYPAYQKSEAGMAVSLRSISEESRNILQNLPLLPLAEARKRNAGALCGYLAGLAGIKILPLGDVPFCVPVFLEGADAAEIAADMARGGVFCARHWANPAASAEISPQSHDLARKLLSLPCDHRYDERDMKIVADTLKNALSALK